jgi:hypothetical protein
MVTEMNLVVRSAREDYRKWKHCRTGPQLFWTSEQTLRILSTRLLRQSSARARKHYTVEACTRVARPRWDQITFVAPCTPD